MKKTGVLNVWFHDRRYGFVHEQRGDELVSHFLHATNVASGTPRTGATVVFQCVNTSKGSLAINAVVQP